MSSLLVRSELDSLPKTEYVQSASIDNFTTVMYLLVRIRCIGRC